jgi:ketosteroid isomerase-like protein
VTGNESHGPVERLWAAIQARDWAAAEAELAPDVVIDWPATGERLSGRAAYLEMQRIYPEGWSIEVRHVVHEGDRVAAEVRVPHGDDVFFCAAFYDLRGGVVVRGVEHWSDGTSRPAPAWRAHLVEPIDER